MIQQARSGHNGLTWETACAAVIAAAMTRPEAHGLQYAAAYAQRGLGMKELAMQRAQALYILSNLNGWRGQFAREVKQVFKLYGERK